MSIPIFPFHLRNIFLSTPNSYSKTTAKWYQLGVRIISIPVSLYLFYMTEKHIRFTADNRTIKIAVTNTLNTQSLRALQDCSVILNLIIQNKNVEKLLKCMIKR